MRYLVILFLLTTAAESQTFDFLTDFEPGTRITFSFVREGSASSFMPDPRSRFHAFSGTIVVTTDSIALSVADSTRVYHLSFRKAGLETVIGLTDTISRRSVDTVYAGTITEQIGIDYRAGANRVTGWIVADTVRRGMLCPHEVDNARYYRYPFYFRTYVIPAMDSFETRGDTLVLRDRWSDCLESGLRWEYRATPSRGLVECRLNSFNTFDWSVSEQYVKTLVSGGTSVSRPAEAPALSPNFPNPFRASTRIAYRLATAGFATVRVCDLLGRTVQVLSDGYQRAGTHDVLFDAGQLPHGVYVYTLTAGDFSQSRTLLLLE